MTTYNLPVDYDGLSRTGKKQVREQYIKEQSGLCYHCGEDLSDEPPARITEKSIVWKFFPPGFLNNPVHLQHDHGTGLTEGAVHAYCNAVMWQYHGK